MTHALPESDVRIARLFRNNRSQAIRIPADFEFVGSRVLIRKDGDTLIITPEPSTDLVDILRGLSPLAPEDQFPDDINSTLLPPDDIDL